MEGPFKVTVGQMITDMEAALKHGEDGRGTPNRGGVKGATFFDMKNLQHMTTATTSWMLGGGATKKP